MANTYKFRVSCTAGVMKGQVTEVDTFDKLKSAVCFLIGADSDTTEFDSVVLWVTDFIDGKGAAQYTDSENRFTISAERL